MPHRPTIRRPASRVIVPSGRPSHPVTATAPVERSPKASRRYDVAGPAHAFEGAESGRVPVERVTRETRPDGSVVTRHTREWERLEADPAHPGAAPMARVRARLRDRAPVPDAVRPASWYRDGAPGLPVPDHERARRDHRRMVRAARAAGVRRRVTTR